MLNELKSRQRGSDQCDKVGAQMLTSGQTLANSQPSSWRDTVLRQMENRNEDEKLTHTPTGVMKAHLH